MVAPVPPSKPSTGGSRSALRAAPAALKAAPGESPGGMAAGRRTRLQFLLDIAQATFSQPGTPTPAQIDALRRTLSSVPLEELGLGEHASLQQAAPASPARSTSSSAAGADSAASSRSSSPSLTDGPHALLGRLLAEEEAEAEAAADREPRPPITYLLIYEDERVSLGIFCLPARARIPLHNHPGMTVLSRVLYGQMHVCSYDWASQQQQQSGGEAKQQRQRQPPPGQQQQGAAAEGGEAQLPRAARVVLDRTLQSGDQPIVLFPKAGGNIHQFTAVTDCAVLDLMSPPYSTEDGRDCTYYSLVPRSSSSRAQGLPHGEVLLDSYEPPADFVINQGLYRGVQPRPKLTPLFAGTSLFPSAHGGEGSPTASSGESPGEGAAAAAGSARGRATPSPPPVPVSPVSSPGSDATGLPKLRNLLADGP